MAPQHVLLAGLLLSTGSVALAATTTGSHIDREPGETCGARNVTVMTRDDLERSGAMTVADAVRRTAGRPDTAMPECKKDKPPEDSEAGATETN